MPGFGISRFGIAMVFFEVLKQGSTAAHDREKELKMNARSNCAIADRRRRYEYPTQSTSSE